MQKLRWPACFQALTIVFLLVSNLAYGQYSGITMQNLSTVKVDELSDEQINKFWTQAQASGLSLDKLEELARQRKMPPAELAKLRMRIEKLGGAGVVDINTDRKVGNGKPDDEKVDAKDINAAFSTLKPKIFGSDLFSNKNLTFEPDLKIATPQNYQLGPDDELIIDVFGNSEMTHKLKISPEGNIRIPNIGPVSVGGLSIEQAEKRIASHLSGIYSGISSGETSVNVTLGNIRSIKVILLGEISMPGTYTLPSLATAFNALYASGGPNENGSMRNIKLIRANKTIATLDVYDFLVKGESKGNIRLQDQDIIKVANFENRVELAGEVKRPGIYEAVKGQTLQDMLSYAGGFTDNAYRERIKVYRNTPKEKSVADVDEKDIPTFVVHSGDMYTIGKLLNRYSNRVQLSGAVFRPGYFALEKGLTLRQLIIKADGPTEDALGERGIIYRLKPDNTQEVLSFNLTDVMSGKSDIPLQREDNIIIASRIELREAFTVSISGEVMRPGVYQFGENMNVEDLIIAAGGLREAASTKVEIARRVRATAPASENSSTTTIIRYEIAKDLKSANQPLQPFDNVTIFPDPGYSIQKKVTIQGEVVFPGQYSLAKKNERLSELLQRAGGLTPFAFADGAVLIRAARQGYVENILKAKKVEALEKQSTDSLKSKELAEDELANQGSVVGIDLVKIMKRAGSSYDLVLEENDIIQIPKLLQTVKVSGEVLYPMRVKYDKGKSLKSYVSGAGGYTSKALRKRSYVVYANGTASATTHFLFLNFYPKVKPGSEVFVPVREDKRKLSAVEIASIATSTATLALLIITLFK